jgi:hypothetical protein
MLLPTDDKPFEFEPTPIPELANWEESDEVQTFADGTQAPAKDVVKMLREKAKEISEKSETRIWDWLVEAGWHGEGRKLIENTALTGTGVMMGPIPYYKKTKRVDHEEGGAVVIQIEEELQPKSLCVPAENVYPDPACGEDIHNGKSLWFKDDLSVKQIKELLDKDYLDDQIIRYLKEKPDGESSDRTNAEKGMHEIWFRYGPITEEDMNSAGCECGDKEEPDIKKEIPAIITMLGDYVIKAAQDPLDSGEFPFDVLRWQRKKGCWYGVGVARQVRVPQQIVNAGTRTMLKNGGLSAGPITFLDKNGIEPADSKWELCPYKLYYVDTSDGTSVRDHMHMEMIPNLQQEFQAIINYGLDLAERLTSMPLMLQGQQGTATDKVGGMEILQLNANGTRRRIARAADDYVFKPHFSRYYEWLLIYGEDPDEKGDSTIRVKGSTAFFERDAQNQALLQMAAIAKDPESGIDFSKYTEEVLRASKIDPARLLLSDEEQQARNEAMAAAAQQGPGDAQRETAMIRAETDLQKAAITQESDMAELQLKAEMELAKIQHQAAESALNRQHEREMKIMDWEIKAMEFSEKSGIEIEKLKTLRTKTSMELNVQERVSGKALAAKVATEAARPKTEVKKAPVEPAGRAANTQAFSL